LPPLSRSRSALRNGRKARRKKPPHQQTRETGDGMSIWRHKKRGSEYKIIGQGKLQVSSHVAAIDDEWVVIYQNMNDGALWVRPSSEFFDGRFEKVTTSAECSQGKTASTKEHIMPETTSNDQSSGRKEP
jgi:hypothetical protein